MSSINNNMASMLKNMDSQMNNGGIEKWYESINDDNTFKDIHSFIKKACIVIPQVKDIDVWLDKVSVVFDQQIQYDIEDMDTPRDYEYERYDHERSPIKKMESALNSEYYKINNIDSLFNIIFGYYNL